MRIALTLSLLIALGLAAGSATAHHGWSGYDSDRPLQLTGVVRESGYEHPHGYVKLETPGKTWLVVLAPPSRMERRGLPREMLRPGMTASVEGYPHRTVVEEMGAERIAIDGKTVEFR